MIQIEKPQFKKIIMTIGNLPSSYVESLSYYECMLWLCNYLENTVIPAVNNNGEAVEELQAKYIELKDYVDHYFDNLDVQEEINKKLDEMTEDGTLTNLIKYYVDPIYQEFENEINEDISQQNSNINDFIDTTNGSLSLMERQISSVASGAPKAVTSIDDMTDTTKIYVLTSDGYWYWYNGTQWTRGGIYQASVNSDEVNNLKITKMDKTTEKNMMTPVSSGTGAYKTDGTITSNAANTYKIYDVSDVLIAYVSGRNHANLHPLVLFLDSNSDVVSYISTGIDEQVVTDYEVTIPDGCKYMVVNGRTSSPAEAIPSAYYYNYLNFQDSFDNALENTEIEKDLNVKMNMTIGKVELTAIATSTGAKNVDGSVSTNSSNTFKTFDVEDVTEAYINGRNHYNLTPLCLFYNSDMELLSYISTGVDNDVKTNYEVDIPNGCKYMIVNGRTSTPAEAIPKAYAKQYIDFTQSVTNYLDNIKNTDLNTPLKNPYENGGLGAIFPKIACIGDSLTKGGMDWENPGTGILDTSYYSYPSNIQRILNCTVYNMGSSGACASPVASESQYNDWNYRATQEGWFTDSYKAYAYIIALGTNDIGFGGSFTGNVATDIDDEDYNNNADTSVGGYAKVIQRILELQPKAKIFCVTIPNTRNSLETRTAANEKIIAIAEHFDCYVIDLQTYGVQPTEVSAWKAIYYHMGHLNCLGYKELSNMILQYLDYIIYHNPDEFYDVPAIESDFS